MVGMTCGGAKRRYDGDGRLTARAEKNYDAETTPTSVLIAKKRKGKRASFKKHGIVDERLREVRRQLHFVRMEWYDEGAYWSGRRIEEIW